MQDRFNIPKTNTQRVWAANVFPQNRTASHDPLPQPVSAWRPTSHLSAPWQTDNRLNIPRSKRTDNSTLSQPYHQSNIPLRPRFGLPQARPYLLQTPLTGMGAESHRGGYKEDDNKPKVKKEPARSRRSESERKRGLGNPVSGIETEHHGGGYVQDDYQPRSKKDPGSRLEYGGQRGLGNPVSVSETEHRGGGYVHNDNEQRRKKEPCSRLEYGGQGGLGNPVSGSETEHHGGGYVHDDNEPRRKKEPGSSLEYGGQRGLGNPASGSETKHRGGAYVDDDNQPRRKKEHGSRFEFGRKLDRNNISGNKRPSKIFESLGKKDTENRYRNDKSKGQIKIIGKRCNVISSSYEDDSTKKARNGNTHDMSKLNVNAMPNKTNVIERIAILTSKIQLEKKTKENIQLQTKLKQRENRIVSLKMEMSNIRNTIEIPTSNDAIQPNQHNVDSVADGNLSVLTNVSARLNQHILNSNIKDSLVSTLEDKIEKDINRLKALQTEYKMLENKMPNLLSESISAEERLSLISKLGELKMWMIELRAGFKAFNGTLEYNLGDFKESFVVQVNKIN